MDEALDGVLDVVLDVVLDTVLDVVLDMVLGMVLDVVLGMVLDMVLGTVLDVVLDVVLDAVLDLAWTAVFLDGSVIAFTVGFLWHLPVRISGPDSLLAGTTPSPPSDGIEGSVAASLHPLPFCPVFI